MRPGDLITANGNIKMYRERNAGSTTVGSADKGDVGIVIEPDSGSPDVAFDLVLMHGRLGYVWRYWLDTEVRLS